MAGSVPAGETASGLGGRRRDRFCWDEYKHQPGIELTKWQRLWHGRDDLGAILPLIGRALRHAGPTLRAYRRLLAVPPAAQSVDAARLGVAISPEETSLERYVDRLEELGVRSVLIRIPCWQPGPVLRLRDRLLALRRDGYSFTFALLQDREAATMPARWGAFVQDVAACLEDLEPVIEIGHAPNRKKWGVWHPLEYMRMLDAVSPAREAHPRCRWIGPSVIDFEYHCTMGLLFGERPWDFDGVSALLYVDRRGSPDNRQYRHFDLRNKILLLQAIVAASPHADVPVYLTEFNWPLEGTGRHCPAGPGVTTDEERQSVYLVQYYLTALATAGVAAAHWWQLVARGYGLCDEDDGWRRRASFEALRTLAGELQGGSLERLAARRHGVRGYLVRRDGRATVVAYDATGTSPFEVGSVALSARDVLGRPLAGEALRTLGPSPVYVDLDPSDADAALDAAGLTRQREVATA